MIYHREYFVDRVILEPWVACAINKQCMCRNSASDIDCKPGFPMAYRYYGDRGPIVYGLCHRFDQAGISLILHKLYQEKYLSVLLRSNSLLSTQRGDSVKYFTEQTQH
jgi:hypothetical protein